MAVGVIPVTQMLEKCWMMGFFLSLEYTLHLAGIKYTLCFAEHMNTIIPYFFIAYKYKLYLLAQALRINSTQKCHLKEWNYGWGDYALTVATPVVQEAFASFRLISNILKNRVSKYKYEGRWQKLSIMRGKFY